MREQMLFNDLTTTYWKRAAHNFNFMVYIKVCMKTVLSLFSEIYSRTNMRNCQI